MTDVRFFATGDGGEIAIDNAQLMMDSGLEGAAFLSMFGGNDDDSKIAGDNKKQWWGSMGEPIKKRRYRSETQFLLRSIPATPGNLKRICDAVSRDLDWMKEDLGASIESEVTMPAIGRARITGSIAVNGEKFPFEFVTNWNSAT